MTGQFTDASLVVLGHGTSLNEGSAVPVFQHAAELRRRGIFGEVREGFWKQDPQITEVLGEVEGKRCFIVPLFISEGYFSQEVIPPALGFSLVPGVDASRVERKGAQQFFYCRPVGTHDHMTEVLLARARDIVQRHPFPRRPAPAETTLFIAGHGTDRNEQSRRVIERQAELLRQRNLYASVQAVFMEQEPRIGACYALASTRNLVVVPFFISDGLHVTEDIPVLLGEPERLVKERLAGGKPGWRNPSEKQGKLTWYTSSVGTEPVLAEVILDRVREAVGWA